VDRVDHERQHQPDELAAARHPLTRAARFARMAPSPTVGSGARTSRVPRRPARTRCPRPPRPGARAAARASRWTPCWLRTRRATGWATSSRGRRRTTSRTSRPPGAPSRWPTRRRPRPSSTPSGRPPRGLRSFGREIVSVQEAPAAECLRQSSQRRPADNSHLDPRHHGQPSRKPARRRLPLPTYEAAGPDALLLIVRSRRLADRDLGARTRPKAAAWRRACRAEQGRCPAERDACRRTKAGRHGGAGTSKPSGPARHAGETCVGLVSSGPSEISCAGGIALAARGCFAKSSSVRSGRRWKTVTRCSSLLILYRTEGSHEALSLAA
jgi:hypothetical protein